MNFSILTVLFDNEILPVNTTTGHTRKAYTIAHKKIVNLFSNPDLRSHWAKMFADLIIPWLAFKRIDVILQCIRALPGYVYIYAQQSERFMKQATVLIIGASVSGLASAATLQKAGIDYVIIEKEAQAATPWRNHYERLHLHTPKVFSNLPYKKFSRKIPRYPSRQQVVDYLEDYQIAFSIRPFFNTKALTVQKEGPHLLA